MAPRNRVTRTIGLLLFILIGLVATGVITIDPSTTQQRQGMPQPTFTLWPRTTQEYRVINAKDERGAPLPGGVVNVWGNYATRNEVVARCKDGERVAVLERKGDGVRIQISRTACGGQGSRIGWVSGWFLR